MRLSLGLKMLKKDKVLNFSRLVFHYIYINKYIYIYICIYFMIFCLLHIFCIIINLSMKLIPLENRHLNLKNRHKFYLIYIWNKKSMIVWSWNTYAISRRLVKSFDTHRKTQRITKNTQWTRRIREEDRRTQREREIERKDIFLIEKKRENVFIKT